MTERLPLAQRKSEAWSFDITGFKEIVMELTALTNGNFSVRGTAVS